jgi:hypothetical protein
MCVFKPVSHHSLNLYVVLIAARLWYIRQRVQISRTVGTLTTVMRIVIESASIYSISILLYLVTYVVKSNVSIIFGDMVRISPPFLLLTFTSITSDL